MSGLLFLFSLNSIYAIDYYVDVNSIGGPCDDKNSGSIEKPWKTIGRALTNQAPCPGAGDTIYLRDGVYKEEAIIHRGGTADKPLTIKAYPGEEPVIDAEGIRKNGIVLPGAWPDRAKSVLKVWENTSACSTDNVDYVVIDSLKVANATNDYAILVVGRKGIVIQNTEVVNSLGVYFVACTECRLLTNHIHHCASPVLICSPSSDIVIADNHIHHSTVPMESRGSDCISISGGSEYVIQSVSGNLASIEAAGPGLARFTVGDENTPSNTGNPSAKLLLNKKISVIDHLRGTGDVAAGEVKTPNYILLFYSVMTPFSDNDEKDIIAGGPVQLNDGRKWFVLHNNPEWDNKPYSPDGKQGLFEIGQARMEDLAKAKYCYIAQVDDPAMGRNHDIQVLRNHLHDATRQGILVSATDNILIQGNRVHDNGATGIQIETDCRHIWIERNESYANCQRCPGETGIWLDEDIDGVVQNNVIHESLKGMEVTHSSRILARRNVIYDNRGQHSLLVAKRDFIWGSRGYSGGFVMNGGRHPHLGAPPTVTESAFVHNTLYANGTSDRCGNQGALIYGQRDSVKIGRNLILNNIIRNEHKNIILLIGKVLPLGMDGNIYYVPGNIADVICQAPDKKDDKTYSIVTKEGFEQYKKEMGLDAHSLFTDVAFADVARKDFHLAKGSSAIDQGVPLAKTVSEGKGEMLPVDNVWCFTAGFKNSKGETLIPGDEIMVGKTRARVVGINRETNILTLDHKIKWKKDDPVNYVYNGSAPDAGAFEWER